MTGRRRGDPPSPAETVTLEPAARGAAPSPWVTCLTVVDHPRPEALGRRASLAEPGALLVGRRAEWLGPDTFRDGRVSREHARLQLEPDGQLTVEDLGSHNGTFVDGARVSRVRLREGAVLGIGGVQLLVHRGPADHVPERSGGLVAVGAAMATCVAQIDRWAAARAPLVIVGEPGTGRTSLAERAHARGGGPLVTVGARSLPDELVATTLLGRRRGAYPGADEAAPGLLEVASGGTLVLDGLEATRPALASTIAQALDAGAVRRVGGEEERPIDVRLVAIATATPRELAMEGVLHSGFAARFGLAVVRVPPLRERKEDIPLLARSLLEAAGVAPGPVALEPTLVRALLAHDWPGNVRELAALLVGAAATSGGAPIALSAELAAALGATVDHAALVGEDGAVTLARSGAFFVTAAGQRVELAHRRSLHGIVARLVEAASATDAPALSVDDLFAAGWPGEKATRSAAATRVYVAVATLRKEGLRDAIARDAAGYRLVLGPAARLLDA